MRLLEALPLLLPNMALVGDVVVAVFLLLVLVFAAALISVTFRPDPRSHKVTVPLRSATAACLPDGSMAKALTEAAAPVNKRTVRPV